MYTKGAGKQTDELRNAARKRDECVRIREGELSGKYVWRGSLVVLYGDERRRGGERVGQSKEIERILKEKRAADRSV